MKKILVTIVLAMILAGCGGNGSSSQEGNKTQHLTEAKGAYITLKIADGSSTVTVNGEEGENQINLLPGGGYWDASRHKGGLRGEIISITAFEGSEIRPNRGIDVGNIVVAESYDDRIISIVPGDTVELICNVELREGRNYTIYWCKVQSIIPAQ